MTTKAQQDYRFWLTPAGCAVVDGHQPDIDGHHCRICGAQLGGAS